MIRIQGTTRTSILQRVAWPMLCYSMSVVIQFLTTTASGQLAGTGDDWPTYGGNLGSQRYSTLDQITRQNVSTLKASWVFQTGYTSTLASFECTPLVIDGVMYLTSPKNDVYALDAASGSLIWSYEPKLELDELLLCCGRIDRGVAVNAGRVFLTTLDARLIALDASTGSLVDAFGQDGIVEVADATSGYSLTSAPVVWDGKIFLGIAGGEYLTRGFFSAYDEKTGELLWRWKTIPDASEFGGDTWPDTEVRDVGGVAAWMTPSIDSESRTVFFGTGNPNPDFDGAKRPGDNLFSVCVVALDADTGERRWHFQEVRHDIWDYDQAATPILFSMLQDGREVKAIGAAGKVGWFYILDRKTGRALLPMKEVEVVQSTRQATAPTQRIPDVPSFVEQINLFVPPNRDGVLIAPAISGGSEWSPTAYSPKTNLAYIAAIHKPMIYTLEKSENPLEEDFGMVLGAMVDPDPSTELRGDFIAIDVNSGLVRWRTPTKPQPVGGLVATAGNVVFVGEANGHFIAMDAETGERLWQFNCGAGVNAAPMTYAVNGRQYVAVAAGGLALESLTSGVAGLENYRRGDAVFVFSLAAE